MKNRIQKKYFGGIGKVGAILLFSLIISIIGNALSPVRIEWFPRIEKDLLVKNPFPEISIDKAVKLLKSENVIFIDARSAKSHKKSHIPTSINVPYRNVEKIYEEKLSYLPKDILLVVYCSSEDCSLAVRVAKKIKNFGFTNISILKGGFSGWLKRGNKVEKSE